MCSALHLMWSRGFSIDTFCSTDTIANFSLNITSFLQLSIKSLTASITTYNPTCVTTAAADDFFIEDERSYNLQHLCIWLRCQSKRLQHQSQCFLKSSWMGVSTHVICSVMWLKTNTSFALCSSRTALVKEKRLTYKYVCNVNMQQLDRLNISHTVCNLRGFKSIQMCKTTVQHLQLSCKLSVVHPRPTPPIWLAPRLITKRCLRVFLSRRGWGWMNDGGCWCVMLTLPISLKCNHSSKDGTISINSRCNTLNRPMLKRAPLQNSEYISKRKEGVCVGGSSDKVDLWDRDVINYVYLGIK